MIPATAVAVVMGRTGIDQLLVASQVVLSIVLPFAIFPLVWLTTNKKIMSVKKPPSDTTILTPGDSPSESFPNTPTASKSEASETGPPEEHDVEASSGDPTEVVDYSNGKIVAGVGYLVWLVIVVANVYVIVMLGLGKGG